MKKFICIAASLLLLLVGCAGEQKSISVIVREKASGTREAFDKNVGDGTYFLEQTDENGKKLYRTSKNAVEQTKNGSVLSMVAADKNAIGYVSLSSVTDGVRVVSIDGVFPTDENIASGAYKISRPFVIMTTSKVPLTQSTADFLNYLKSDASREFAKKSGCIFNDDKQSRANEGAAPIEVLTYQRLPSIDESQRIIIRGSTSVEKFIFAAAKSYAELYGVAPERLFDIQLEGSSIGKRAAQNDTNGNVIGLSSAAVDSDGIDAFYVAIDAVAVIVNAKNTAVSNLTMSELYGIFSGSISKFEDILS